MSICKVNICKKIAGVWTYIANVDIDVLRKSGGIIKNTDVLPVNSEKVGIGKNLQNKSTVHLDKFGFVEVFKI